MQTSVRTAPVGQPDTAGLAHEVLLACELTGENLGPIWLP